MRNRDRGARCESAASACGLEPGRRLLHLAGTSALVLLSLTAVPAAAALTEGTRLAGIYRAIHSGRPAAARAEVAQACPPAPVEACRALEVVALWWEIQLNPNSRQLDPALERAAAISIAAASEWTRREPGRAEAWFYLAGSYAPLAQWRVLRGRQLAAARDGKRIKEALERAIALDPTLKDAYFGIGLYHYYADVAPTALKMLRWLLLLPGGDRKQGMREMLQAREEGELLRDEADYQLHWLYLWYEHQPQAALDLLRGLDARYPSNAVFVQRIAEVQHEYFHDHAASAAAWQTLIQRAGEKTIVTPRLALAHYELANEFAHLGERDRAIESYRLAIAHAAGDDVDNVRERARNAIRKF